MEAPDSTSMNKPRALDLFCGAGGVTKGLQRAGFHVTGVDNKPQLRYCGEEFIQGDALSPAPDLSQWDFIWASPPCLAFTLANNKDARGKHENLIPGTRKALEMSGALTCIENVPGAPLRCDLVLDGTMFPDLKVLRRRHFELNFPAPFLLGFDARHHVSQHGWATPTNGGTSSSTRAARVKNGLPPCDTDDGRAKAMGIGWMLSRQEIANAIPPAYSEFIGRAALKCLQADRNMPLDIPCRV